MDLGDLYQQLILDHNARPRHFGVLQHPSHRAAGVNPLCGDQLDVTLMVDDAGVITDVAFSGSGCAISKASASIMTECVKGKTCAQAEALFAHFHDMVAGDGLHGMAEPPPKLQAFSGVREFPARVKCATLAWHTLRAALHHEASVSTES